MRICIEVKDNKTQHLRLFVEFLRHWFSNRKLDHRFAALEYIADAPVLDRVHSEDAIADAESALKMEPDHWHSLVQDAQAAATTSPLDAALEPLGAAIDLDKIIADGDEYVEDFSTILSVSVRRFGPRYLHQGVVMLRKLLAGVLDKGLLGNILADFLFENLNAFKGSLEEWVECFERSGCFARRSAGLPDTRRDARRRGEIHEDRRSEALAETTA